MASKLPPILLRLSYQKAAEDYLRSLPLDHFMEATAQATQRAITLASFALVHARRPDVQVFNELLVQYPLRGEERLGQVVPDNMVVVWPESIQAEGSYDLPFQPVGPFWTLEYVSQHSRRKDYDVSMRKYERLKIPYYLVFYPDGQELTLFRYGSRKYVTVKPNDKGRLAISELEMEVALVDGWARFWHRGELLPLPADLQRDLEAARRRLRQATRRAKALQQRADAETQRADELQARVEAVNQAKLNLEREVAQLRAALAESKARPRRNGSTNRGG
jgi:Uma2 family endonuclease